VVLFYYFVAARIIRVGYKRRSFAICSKFSKDASNPDYTLKIEGKVIEFVEAKALGKIKSSEVHFLF